MSFQRYYNPVVFYPPQKPKRIDFLQRNVSTFRLFIEKYIYNE